MWLFCGSDQCWYFGETKHKEASRSIGYAHSVRDIRGPTDMRARGLWKCCSRMVFSAATEMTLTPLFSQKDLKAAQDKLALGLRKYHGDHGFEVKGSKGIYSGLLDGIYTRKTDATLRGQPVYCKLFLEGLDDPDYDQQHEDDIVWFFYGRDGCWYLADQKGRDSEVTSGYAVSVHMQNPTDSIGRGRWKCNLAGANTFSTVQKMTVTYIPSAKALDEAKNIFRDRISSHRQIQGLIVCGAVGPSCHLIDGVYIKDDKLIRGHSAFYKETTKAHWCFFGTDGDKPLFIVFVAVI